MKPRLVERAAPPDERCCAANSLLLLACSLALTLAVGCQSSAPERVAESAAQTNQRKETARTFEAHVFEDEAMLRGSQAVIGGTLRNISGRTLENLVVELELKRRGDGSTETRELRVTPPSLEPGAEGRYTTTVTSRDWSSSRIARIRSDASPEEIAFRSEVGARRPPERIPEGRERIRIVPRPKPKKGDDYLNTPETADPIR